MSSNNISFTKQEVLNYHSKGKAGKLEITPTKQLITQRDLSLAYSPGVAVPCLEIQKNPELAYNYTAKGNLVAVITDGTAVLGLGNLGALAAKPVMEGKAVLFKRFAGIDSIDIEVTIDKIDIKNEDRFEKYVEQFISTVKAISPTFGGINLEDIKSPECFVIEEKLNEVLDIPVFHDDQHGTAIIVCAGIINAVEITKRKISELKVVVNGCGAAGVACIELMKSMGVKEIIVCDQNGIIHTEREFKKHEIKQKYAIKTDLRTLEDALISSDMFLGLSVADALKPEYLKQMNKDPIIFALANPDPEIKPELAKQIRPDAIIATGRSDYNNQVNNVMCFPYIFRGALDVFATKVNIEMKLAAVHAIAGLARKSIPDEVSSAYSDRIMSYGKNYILPTPFDPRLISTIAPAVAKAAIETKVARKEIDLNEYKQSLMHRFSPVSNVFSIISKSIKNHKKRIIFAEGEEQRAIRAALQWRDMGYGTPILVGRQNIIEERMKELAIHEHSGIEIANAAISARNEDYIEYMYKTLQRDGYLHRTCIREVKTDRNAFASCMLACGDGDALITGLTRSYRTSLNEILPIIGNGGAVFGLSIILANNRTLFVADTAVNSNPTAEKLAEIVIKSAEVVRNMGHEPRIALVAHSNFGSFQNEASERSRQCLKILDNKKLDFEYDGEMNIDVALNAESLKTYPFCRLTNPANVIIMPNIESANAACKLIKELGSAHIIGPILIGAKKSVQIVQISAGVTDILNSAIIAAKASESL